MCQANVIETANPGTHVVTANATDLDCDQNAQGLSYAIFSQIPAGKLPVGTLFAFLLHIPYTHYPSVAYPLACLCVTMCG